MKNLLVKPEDLFEQLEEWYPGRFEIEYDRDAADYVYESEKLATLAGKKLHAKRNHINKFKATYEGRWNYETLTKENVEDCFQMALEWRNKNGCEEDEEKSAEKLEKRQLLSKGDESYTAIMIEITGLTKDVEAAQRGITITELENAYQMCSNPDYYDYLIRIAKTPRKYVLTDALLETLSIIAYKQPVTRLDVEKIRGVNCDHAINRLIEFDLVKELGRLDAPGRPLLFGTTEQFLRSFGVKSLEDLPEINPMQVAEFKEQAEQEVQLSLNI